jgi:glycine cleavage system transcriptional repressor
MKRFALTAIGRDRPGIVAAVTKALFEHRCNIEDSSMTILEDEFAMILIMTMPERENISPLRMELESIEKSMGLTIHLKEIHLEKGAEARPLSNHIITLHGADKAGIVYKTAALLSGKGINITDLETKILGEDKKKIYIMIMEVFVPSSADTSKMADELSNLGRTLGVTIRLKPIEAFEPL